MRASSSILALTAAAVIPSSVSAQNDTSINCVEGLYMIVARGSNEPEGEGRLVAIVNTVMGRIRGSDSLGLDYPATIDDPNYFESVAEGGKAMKSAVEEYHEACPEGRMAVLGYSQGAHISMDALCGGGVAGFEDLTPLPLNLVESSIVAMIMYGDPTFVANATYSEGTSENSGIFPRENIEECEAIGDGLVSYCDAGDIYCDNEGDEDGVHGEYFERYNDDVVNFIVSRYRDAVSSSSTTSLATTPTPTSTETSSTGTEMPTATGEDQPEETDSGAGRSVGAGILSLVSVGLVTIWQVL